MSVERHVTVSNGGLADLDAALAWAVQTHDREFTGASMLKITVEQSMVSGPPPDDDWRYRWTASVSGMVEE